jgi:hypothetical protein
MAKKPQYIIAGVNSSFEAQDLDQNVYRKELVYPGNFTKKDPNTQEVEFTLPVDERLMDHWAATFQKMAKNEVEVPLPIEHTTDPEKRRGTVIDLKKEYNPERGTNSLYAYVKFRDAQTAASLAKTTQVSLFSPPNFSDGKGNSYVRPITHVALTDYPLVPGLSRFAKAVAASLAPAWCFSLDTPDELGLETEMSAMRQLALDFGVKVEASATDDMIADSIRAAMSDPALEEEDPALEDPMLEEDPALETGDPALEEEDPELEFADDPMLEEEPELEEPIVEPALEDESLDPELEDPELEEGLGEGEEVSDVIGLAGAMGIDVGGETDPAAVCQMILEAWNQDDESTEDLEEATGIEDTDSGGGMEFEPATMSASVTAAIAKSRAVQLEDLCRRRKIAPAVRDQFIKKYATTKQVTFAFSNSPDVANDDFDDVVAALSQGNAMFRTGPSKTGPQTRPNNKGALERDAEARAARAKK